MSFKLFNSISIFILIINFSTFCIAENGSNVDIFLADKKVDLSNSSKTMDSSPQGSYNLPTNKELFSTDSYQSNSAADSSSGASSGDSGAAGAAGFSEKANIESNKPPSTFDKDIQAACFLQSDMAQQALKELCTDAPKSTASCSENFIPAGTACNPDTNSSVLQQTALIQTLLSSAQGLTDSCSIFSKAMSLGKAAMAAYTTYCSVKRQMCDSSCSKSVTLVKQMNSAANSIYLKLGTTSCLNPSNTECTFENNDKNRVKEIIKITSSESQNTSPTVANKLKVCATDMTTLLGLGVANIASLAQAKNSSDQCEKQTAANDTVKATDAASATVDCGLSANADKPVCICKANPRLKGCEGVSTSLATNSTMSTGGSGSTSGKGLSGNIGNGTDAAINKQFPSDLAKTNKNDGTSSGSGFGGGSTAGLTGSTDSGSASEAQLSKNASAGNANILSTESGGGGGYRFGLGSNTAGRSQARGVANAGGAKGKLSAMDWSNQVTSVAGKSNFDKIKTRYNENRTSLLAR